MAESSSGPGLNDVMSLFGGVNPLAVIGKSITQLQSGVTNFMHSIENFNETMEQMNGVARRINTMLDDLEPLISTAVPQLTRTLRVADEMVEQMSGPIERVAPGLARLAETLSSPIMTTFPRDLSQFVEMFGDVARRMQPLGQLAETAGGFFGMNPLAALRNVASGGGSGSSGRQSTPPPAPARVASEILPEPPIVHVFDDEPEPAQRPSTGSTGSSVKRSSGTKRAAARKTGTSTKSAAKKSAGQKRTEAARKRS